ncbi:hypothetical protein KP509_19G021500 [Ceratopteris richardii]|nr:hypothetical protein KP509_19G021500 [Ceratopteris richardii]
MALVSNSVPYAEQSFRVTVRQATITDYWGVADTHCGAFFPELVFPMDALLRLDRVVAMLGGLTLPVGCQRKCLVAVGGEIGTNDLVNDSLRGSQPFEKGLQDDLLLGSVLGVLTIDTLAEFLPRRKPTGSRRTGIAYISNVAVREVFRRKGIAKCLVQEAEAVASQWGCRAMALHCDKSNAGALALYQAAGYRVVKVPVDAKWPQPKPGSGSEFSLMFKLLPSR